MTAVLFEPVNLGALALKNRIIMAPMTRDRAGPGDVPTDLMAEYYRQRASAGMIITEGTQPSREGKGSWRTPGIQPPWPIDRLGQGGRGGPRAGGQDCDRSSS